MAMLGKPPAIDPNAPVGADGGPISPYLTQPGAMQALPDSSGVMPQIAPQHQGGPSWAGILGDALLGAAGQPGQYGPAMYRQRQMQLENDMYVQREQAQFERQRQLYDYQMQHPNSEFDQAVRGALIHQGDPTGPLYTAHAWNMATPPQMITQTDGNTGITTSGMIRPQIPSAAGPQTGGLTEAQILAMGGKPAGGQTPPASGGFQPGSKSPSRGGLLGRKPK